MKGTSQKPTPVRAALSIIVAASFVAAPAASCSLEALDLSGFSIDHRGSIPVALATREAIEKGFIAELPKDNVARYSALYIIRLKAVSHMQRLTWHSDHEGPALVVLLTQSGAWMRINDPETGARYHADPATETETALLLPDTAYAALLDGELTVRDATELGLLRVYGTENEDVAISTFASSLNVLEKKG